MEFDGDGEFERIETQRNLWYEECRGCRRRFYHPNGLPNHVSACASLRRQLKRAQEQARAKLVPPNVPAKKGLAALSEWFNDDESNGSWRRDERAEVGSLVSRVDCPLNGQI